MKRAYDGGEDGINRPKRSCDQEGVLARGEGHFRPSGADRGGAGCLWPRGSFLGTPDLFELIFPYPVRLGGGACGRTVHAQLRGAQAICARPPTRNPPQPDPHPLRTQPLSQHPRAAALADVKAAGPGAAWRAAKEAVLRRAVTLHGASEDASNASLALTGRVAWLPGGGVAGHPHHTPPGDEGPRSVAVAVVLDASSGAVLDARAGCCPGGWHPVLGCFCPTVGALLLAAAGAARSEGGLQAATAGGSSDAAPAVVGGGRAGCGGVWHAPAGSLRARWGGGNALSGGLQMLLCRPPCTHSS